MKKLFLLAVLSAVVCGAAAHPNHIFGVRVGMNIANMTFKAGGVSATPNSVVRPLVAFSYEKSLMHTLPLYFETGLGIAGYGTSISDGAVKLNAYYFEAPALVNWRFGLTEDVSLIPYLGLSMRVGFAGKVKSGSAKADTFGDGGFDRFDMGVRAGIGVEYRRYSFRSVTMRDSSISPMCRTSRFATRRSSCNWATASDRSPIAIHRFPCRCGGGRSF